MSGAATEEPTAARRFPGRTVLVTGASRGLGRAIALAFAAEGAWVAFHYRHHGAEAEAALQEARALGADGMTLGFDVTDRAAVDAGVLALCERRGAIDILVNNAGIARDELFPMMEARSFEEVMDVNVGGPYHLSRAVTRPMLARKRGVIVNIGSAAATRSVAGQVGYATSKAALAALTRSVAIELAPRGVRVNAVVPGYLTTGMASRMDHRHLERVRAAIPLGRAGTAAEVVAVVLFVASDAASYVVGQSIVVDGGLVL